MYRYRLVFPAAADQQLEHARTAMIESVEPYEVGSTIEFEGKTWQVTQVPLEQQNLGDYADLRVWPVEG